MTITEDRLNEIAKQPGQYGALSIQDPDTAVELIRLASLGLEYQELKSSVHGKANLMFLIECGKWALHHAFPAIKRVHDYASLKFSWGEMLADTISQFPKEGEK